jgi:hypothetical protein
MLSTINYDSPSYFDATDVKNLFDVLIGNAIGERKFEYFNFLIKWMEMPDSEMDSGEMIPWLKKLDIDLDEVVIRYLNGEMECFEYTMCGFIFPIVGLAP